MRAALTTVLACAAWCLPTMANAQFGDIQNYSPSGNTGGMATVMTGVPLDRGRPAFSVSTVYARDPLILTGAGGRRLSSIVSDRFDLILHGAVGLTSFMDIGVTFPVVGFQQGQAKLVSGGARSVGDQHIGIADPTLRARFAILHSSTHGLNLAISPALTLPLANNAHAGNPTLTVQPDILVSKDLGRVALAGNLGYRWIPGLVDAPLGSGHQIRWRLGVGYRVGRAMDSSVNIELFGALDANAPFAQQRATPTEALLSGAMRRGTLLIRLGLGLGIIKGYGAPIARGIVGISWAAPEAVDPEPIPTFAEVSPTPAPEPQEADEPVCEETPEAPCPVLDSDLDSIPDDADRCPLEPEDHDEFEDSDGCLDADNDNDTIADVVDACPNHPELFNGFEDDDGCPDEDTPVVTLSSVQIETKRKAVFFGIGSHELLPRAQHALKAVAALLARHDELAKVTIEGYADPAGSEQGNYHLSWRRARAVRKFLVKHGVDRNRLDIIGFGEAQSPVSDEHPRAKALNRRVQFRIATRSAP